FMDKCPHCGAETRPGDNFCLNCGNRLLPASPSFQQASPVGEATVAAQDDWMMPAANGGGMPSPVNWSDANAPTIAAPSGGTDLPTIRSDSASVAQATINKIEKPAHLVLRAENGDVLQEFVLVKP